MSDEEIIESLDFPLLAIVTSDRPLASDLCGSAFRLYSFPAS
jgi:hypothetical protein